MYLGFLDTIISQINCQRVKALSALTLGFITYSLLLLIISLKIIQDYHDVAIKVLLKVVNPYETVLNCKEAQEGGLAGDSSIFG